MRALEKQSTFAPEITITQDAINLNSAVYSCRENIHDKLQSIGLSKLKKRKRFEFKNHKMKERFVFFLTILLSIVQGIWAFDGSDADKNFKLSETSVNSSSAFVYCERSWDEVNKKVVTTSKSCSDYTILEGNHEDDWLMLGSADNQKDYYYVVKGVVEYKTLNVFGNAHLILTDGAKLTCNGGIKVEKHNNNATLSIYSQSDGENEGLVELMNYYKNAACIGSAKETLPGRIIFHGGRFSRPYSAGNGAAIGGGENAPGGELIFYGGDYKIHGGMYSAAIGGGGGKADPNTTNGGTIKIYGGTFELKGSDETAAIGGGHKGNSGTIDIYGGDITAIAGDGGSGIGHGASCTTTNEGHINIHGGHVTAKGDDKVINFPVVVSFPLMKYSGAAIGGADGSAGGNISISGGEVEATSGLYSAAIGGGYKESGGNITISGGTVKALQKLDAYNHQGYGAGIGGGEDGHGGTITITGGTITADGGMDAAAIGGGEGGDSGDITISGGDITATALYYGSAIGAGEDGKVNTIKLLGGKIKATGGEDGWAVGSEQDPRSGTIIISDNLKVTSERTFTTAERVEACRWRRSVTIEQCDHTAQNGDAEDIVRTYDISDEYHTMHCRYCDVSIKEEHKGELCICGKNNVCVFYLYMPGKEKDSYEKASPITIGIGKEYYLPKCLNVPEGYSFKGWEMNPDPENIGGWAAVLGGDESGETVMPAGKSVKALSGQTPPNFYARYLYVFNQVWTWADDASWASVTLSHPHLTDVTLASTGSDPKVTIKQEDLNEYVETEGEDGTLVLEAVKIGTHYTATATYIVNGYKYTFTADKAVKNSQPEEPEETALELELNDSKDNTQTLTENGGKKANVTLSGRTFFKDGSWNTICLPFDVDNITGTPLEGATIMTLASSDFNSSTGTLTLNFSDTRHALSAGMPYVVKWESGNDIKNPVFNGVVIEAGASSVGSPFVDFVGTFSPVGLEQDDRKVLFMGGNNTVYYPNKNVTVNACRAYFKLHNGIIAGDPKTNGAKVFVLNFGDEEVETGISLIPDFSTKGEWSAGAWYSIDGRKLSGKPTQKGLYIHNGKKVVVK